MIKLSSFLKVRSDTTDLGKSIVTAACNSEAKDVAFELAEIGLDSLLDDGILKEIPGFRTILACRTTWNAIHDRLFLRKVAGFLLALPKFTEEQRGAFAREHLNDAEKAKTLGDTLVLILDRLDDLEKPAMLSKIFVALVRGKIGLETFRRLAAAIDIGFIEDLRGLANDSKQARGVTAAYADNLVRTGLSGIEHGVAVASGFGEPCVAVFSSINELGKLFIECMNQS